LVQNQTLPRRKQRALAFVVNVVVKDEGDCDAERMARRILFALKEIENGDNGLAGAEDFSTEVKSISAEYIGDMTEHKEDKETIFKYMDLSTNHVSKKTMDWLDAAEERTEPTITIAPYDYGCFVGVPQEPETYTELPKDLLAVLVFARANNCDVVRFDKDGETRSEIKLFNW